MQIRRTLKLAGALLFLASCGASPFVSAVSDGTEPFASVHVKFRSPRGNDLGYRGGLRSIGPLIRLEDEQRRIFEVRSDTAWLSDGLT